MGNALASCMELVDQRWMANSNDLFEHFQKSRHGCVRSISNLTHAADVLALKGTFLQYVGVASVVGSNFTCQECPDRGYLLQFPDPCVYLIHQEDCCRCL